MSTNSYLSFTAALKSKLAAEGVTLRLDPSTPTGLPENAGWVKFESSVNEQKLYVKKSQGQQGFCETTVVIPSSTPGFLPLPKVNGKIHCRYAPDIDLIVKHIAPHLTNSAARLRAARSNADSLASLAATNAPVAPPVMDLNPYSGLEAE